ncbi:MAG TPA: FAD-dependent oxidoreductase [Candidatus Baltobacteraceae bacterium]
MKVTCAIAGGGPAGMMLGFLLARAGIEVVVLEKHADFLRDFRGDTIHPSTLQLMYELGLLDAFLARPHDELRILSGRFGDTEVTIADFGHVSTNSKFIALMPQWDFLNFIAEQGKKYPAFRVMMQAEATDLLYDQSRVCGLRVRTPDGEIEIQADLVVAADGRSSTLRALAGLTAVDSGAPMDVLWMRLSRTPGDPPQTFGNIRDGRILVTINRNDYWQAAFVIPKGSMVALQAAGLAAFRAEIARTAPFLRDRVDEIQDWKQVSLLTVKVDRLTRWYRDGLLCIGRCSARDVADRRRRHQPGHPRCGRNREPPVRPPTRRYDRSGRPARGPATTRIPHQGDPIGASLHSEQFDFARARNGRGAAAALGAQALGAFSGAAPPAGLRGRRRRAPRTRAHARGYGRFSLIAAK